MRTQKDDEFYKLDDTFIEDDAHELPPSDIVAYNELRSCYEIYRMYQDRIIEINPDFQRDEVWPDAQKTRFIDSLIKKLPIPSMCFSLDYKTEELQVIDGLQRISSIVKFFDDENDWKLSNLNDIDRRISGKYASEIKEIENGLLYRRLKNLTIPVTVIRCDYSKESHANYMFTIFHRLNTGGVKLTNQEIRNAIYNGPFNTMLKSCNKYSYWRKIAGIKPNKSYRLSKEEIILRFFSFYDNRASYQGTLTSFLNNYMQEHKKAKKDWLDNKLSLFTETIDLIYDKITEGKVLPKNKNAILEATLYGVGKNIEYLQAKSQSNVKHAYNQLLEDEAFSDDNLREGLATTTKVNNRLDAANRIFSNA